MTITSPYILILLSITSLKKQTKQRYAALNVDILKIMNGIFKMRWLDRIIYNLLPPNTLFEGQHEPIFEGEYGL